LRQIVVVKTLKTFGEPAFGLLFFHLCTKLCSLNPMARKAPDFSSGLVGTAGRTLKKSFCIAFLTPKSPKGDLPFQRIYYAK
jgi:hypothetical protein